MNTKLTLSLDSHIIQSAKRYSKQKGVSLSKIVEEYLEKLSITKSPDKNRSSAADLKGIAGGVSADFDYREDIYKHLMEKHS